MRQTARPTVFDSPHWQWKERVTDSDPVKSINGEVLIRPIGSDRPSRVCHIEPPSEFVHMLHSTRGADATCDGFALLVEGQRYYWVAHVHGADWYLWYWTPSTLPVWAKNRIHGMS